MSSSSIVGDRGTYLGESVMGSKVAMEVAGQDMSMGMRMVRARVIQIMEERRGFLYIGLSSCSGFVIFLK